MDYVVGEAGALRRNNPRGGDSSHHRLRIADALLRSSRKAFA